MGLRRNPCLGRGLQNETVPIPKANQSQHIDESLDVLDFEISDDDMHELDLSNDLSASANPVPLPPTAFLSAARHPVLAAREPVAEGQEFRVE